MNPAVLWAPARTKRLQGLRPLIVENKQIDRIVAKGLLSQEGADTMLADYERHGIGPRSVARGGDGRPCRQPI